MTDDRLRKIRERCNAATPGPWAMVHSECFPDRQADVVSKAEGLKAGERWIADKSPFDKKSGISLVNADFIANARQDVPWLLDEVERLRRELSAEDPRSREEIEAGWRTP